MAKSKKQEQVIEFNTDITQDLLDCYTICLQGVRYCLELGDRHSNPEHLAIMMDCADICQLTASAMFPESESLKPVYAACADMCKKCADSCAQFTDDDYMQACMEMSENCAESCRNISVYED